MSGVSEGNTFQGNIYAGGVVAGLCQVNSSLVILGVVYERGLLVDATENLTGITLIASRTFLTGAVAGASLSIILPVKNNGMILNINSNVERVGVSWVLGNGDVSNLPSLIPAKKTISIIYVQSTNSWYVA